MWRTLIFIFIFCSFHQQITAQFQIEHNQYIQAPPDVVFTYLLDIKYFPQWIGGFVSFRYKSGIPGTSGSQAYQVIQQQGMQFEFIQTLLKIDPNKKIGILMENEKMDIVIEYTFVKQGDGTMLKMTHDVTPKSFLFKTMQSVIRRSYKSNSETNFIAFKNIVEKR